jgi:dimethylargininase
VLVAITRQVSSALARCELTHLARAPIDVERARLQHHLYEQQLIELGCRLERLAEQPELPDSVFVEDAAIVLDEVAVITLPGAPSRRPEIASIAAALTPHRTLRHLAAPATLDGGDVLQIGRVLYVGVSARTNEVGVAQLREAVAPFDYEVRAVRTADCLHLKTAVSEVAEDTVLIHPGWVDAGAFTGVSRIEIDPAEPMAANALRIGDALVHPAAHPRTRARLEAHGIAVRPVDVSELAKAEAGVTCCSLVFRAAAPRS